MTRPPVAPCAFCGSRRAELRRVYDRPPVDRKERRGRKIIHVRDYGKHLGYKVHCWLCNALVQRLVERKGLPAARSDVLGLWNARALDIPSRGVYPCPLCGGKPVESITEAIESNTGVSHKVNVVKCDACGLSLTGLQVAWRPHYSFVEVDAFEAWNTRNDRNAYPSEPALGYHRGPAPWEEWPPDWLKVDAVEDDDE